MRSRTPVFFGMGQYVPHADLLRKWAAPPPESEQLSVAGGTIVADFDEYTFRAPRPGLFLGDSRTPDGDLNPVTRASLDRVAIPDCRPVPPYLGPFDRLAFEIMTQILLDLDIFSLVAFRSVNQRAKGMVDSLPAFQAVVAFPKLLPSILVLQSRFFDLKTLAACIRRPACSYCGHFGELLYLVTAERWCYSCFRANHQFQVLLAPSPSTTTDDTANVEALKQRVPHVLVPAGYYGIYALKSSDTAALAFDHRAFAATPGSPAWANPTVGGGPHACRYMAVIRGPYFDEQTRSFEEGFHCRACAYQGREHRVNTTSEILGVASPFPSWGLPWRKYTRDGMRDHLNRYGRILKLEEGGGKVRYAHERPFPGYSPWSHHAAELAAINDLLRRCRDKEIQLVPLQPFLSHWIEVSSCTSGCFLKFNDDQLI